MIKVCGERPDTSEWTIWKGASILVITTWKGRRWQETWHELQKKVPFEEGKWHKCKTDGKTEIAEWPNRRCQVGAWLIIGRKTTATEEGLEVEEDLFEIELSL